MPHNYRTLLRARTRSLMLYPDCCNEQVSGPYTTRLRDNMLHNNQLSGLSGNPRNRIIYDIYEEVVEVYILEVEGHYNDK